MALIDQSWMRGNRTPRISPRVRELIDQAIDDVALDLKQPNAASVHRRHESLIVLENVKRTANGLEELLRFRAKLSPTTCRRLVLPHFLWPEGASVKP